MSTSKSRCRYCHRTLVGPAFEEAENADHISPDFAAIMSPAICCDEGGSVAVSYTHLRAHETRRHL
eukprot:2448742-Prorocentrum_lima.AAC.1